MNGRAFLVLCVATSFSACATEPGEGGAVAETETLWLPLPPDQEPVACNEGFFDPVCNDDDFCTVDGCLGGICRHGLTWQAQCCNTVADCDDSNPCTGDSCEPDHACLHTWLDLQNCCDDHDDCGPGGQWDDEDPSTIDYCKGYQCIHLSDPSCTCEYVGPLKFGVGYPLPEDAPDGPCYDWYCDGCGPVWIWAPGCCVESSDCDDGDPFTDAECVDGECQYWSLASCFEDSDCDDGKPCTIDECANLQCRHVSYPPFDYCCTNDFDCDDGIACTTGHCDLETNACVFELVPDQDPKCCWTAADCDDGDAYTVEKCFGNVCLHNPLPPCWPSTCKDDNPCTHDVCNVMTSLCEHELILGCCWKDSQCQEEAEPPCLVGKCNVQTHLCLTLEVENCCTSDADCGPGGKWDDGSSATTDICIANECRHVKK
jgi:hypothetical protein